MKTIGKKITAITPLRDFYANFTSATVVFIWSKMESPVYTTHARVGSVTKVLNLG